MVYLDITHLPAETKNKLHAILEIYQKFTGDDPREVPMKIFPAVHYSMGGLYTTYTAYKPETDKIARPEARRKENEGMEFGAPNNGMTNIPGLYSFGEASYAYHGATRLGANALLSCIFDGLFCGVSVANYAKGASFVGKPAAEQPQELYDAVIAQENAKVQKLINNKGTENPYTLHADLGREMTLAATVVKTEARLLEARAKLAEFRKRYEKIGITDTNLGHTNQTVAFTRVLGDMLIYADAIVEGSLARKESRGSHYRDDFQERDDVNFHGTTKASFNPETKGAKIEYEPIPMCLVPPRPRVYTND